MNAEQIHLLAILASYCLITYIVSFFLLTKKNLISRAMPHEHRALFLFLSPMSLPLIFAGLIITAVGDFFMYLTDF